MTAGGTTRRALSATIAALALVASFGVLDLAPSPQAAAQAALPTPGLLPVPQPLAHGTPGSLIASAPFDSGPFPFAVEAHQILFHSTDRTGKDIPVSGYILVPVGVPAPSGGRSVVAWAHGTTGLADGCAPSLDAQFGGRLNSPDSYDRIGDILAAGHIVVASDYPGLGTPGIHPYLDGVGEGRSVLDSIRAAQAFGANDRAVVEGFSQGSQAAIFAGQEWADYAPDIDLLAVVGIGTPSRYGEAFAALDLPVVQSYIAKVLAGIVAGHPELDRSEILTPSGEVAYGDFAALDSPDVPYCANPSFDLGKDLAANPYELPDWKAALDANNPGQQNIPVPVLMVQSESDEQALAFLADGVCRDLVTNGSDVRMWRYQTESHVGTVDTSATDRMTWILDRLDGKALTDGVTFRGEAPRVLTTCVGSDEEQPPTTTVPDPTPASAPTTSAPARTSRARRTVAPATGARPTASTARYTG